MKHHCICSKSPMLAQGWYKRAIRHFCATGETGQLNGELELASLSQCRVWRGQREGGEEMGMAESRQLGGIPWQGMDRQKWAKGEGGGQEADWGSDIYAPVLFISLRFYSLWTQGPQKCFQLAPQLLRSTLVPTWHLTGYIKKSIISLRLSV